MIQLFLCPKCKSEITLPHCKICGNKIKQIKGIYQFTDCENVNLNGENQYIGYDNIGEDFEPCLIYGSNNTEQCGVYSACADLIAKQFGTDITVLDLGAGLGTASIPLAEKGINTITADISNKMLYACARRIKEPLHNITLARMNAYEIMLPDNSVDIVIENALLHLVSNPEKIIKEIVRVLKPNGNLIKYGTYDMPLSGDEIKKRRYCNLVLSDINDKYYIYLKENKCSIIGFDNNYMDTILCYFRKSYRKNADDFTEIFTDKLKYRLHRLKKGAHSDLQNIPREYLDKAWEYADIYAKNKYGNDYMNIKGFARYGASIDVYDLID